MPKNKSISNTGDKPVVGKRPKQLTDEQINEHNAKMSMFYESVKSNRGFQKKYFESADTLIEQIDRYLQKVAECGLYPTETGLMLFLDSTDSWYYAVMNQSNDERAGVLKKFHEYVSEYLNQAGLSGTSNMVFSIYYLKSKMAQYDQPNEINLNINMGQPAIASPSDFAGMIGGMPVIEVEYEEVEG